MSQIDIVYVNPNEDTGGCGCLATGETGSEDCNGPYLVFPATDTASNISPHAVICKHHFDQAAELFGEQGAEPETIDLPESEVEEVPDV